MNSNGLLRKHWLHVSVHFATDAILFSLAMILSLVIRFGEQGGAGTLSLHWPSLLLASVTFSAVTYIAGLYSTHSSSRGGYERALTLGVLNAFAMLMVIGITYLTSARPLGRGVILLGGTMAYVLALLHHVYLLHLLRTTRERVIYVVTSTFDEAETRIFASFSVRGGLDLAGIVTANDYQPHCVYQVLGTLENLASIARRLKVQRVLCTSKCLSDPRLTRAVCELRYSGISVMPLINLCEEVDQCVPLELVTPDWLLNASGEPHLLYIKKLKRAFDIIASLLGLLLAAPLLALSAVAIKLSSPGPVFYRQTRCGRFGRGFEMTKLRTMHVNAETAGAQWSGKNDPRVHRVGSFLRRYRIDEIPQLWHVLSGDMSFVGPRPERPEMTASLAEQVPYYEERLMVQPGITGWAQVSYPYGACVLDTRRKLEYDLYYMKHMSVFLDVFILLDTVRTVLCGGARAAEARLASRPDDVVEWERLKATTADHRLMSAA